MSKVEEIGMCPSCYDKRGPVVNFFAVRDDEGVLTEIHIFGDDDLDVAGDNLIVKEVKFSEDNKNVIEVVCPRCKEHIKVNIPLIKKLDKSYVALHGKPNLAVAEQNEKAL